VRTRAAARLVGMGFGEAGGPPAARGAGPKACAPARPASDLLAAAGACRSPAVVTPAPVGGPTSNDCNRSIRNCQACRYQARARARRALRVWLSARIAGTYRRLPMGHGRLCARMRLEWVACGSDRSPFQPLPPTSTTGLQGHRDQGGWRRWRLPASRTATAPGFRRAAVRSQRRSAWRAQPGKPHAEAPSLCPLRPPRLRPRSPGDLHAVCCRIPAQGAVPPRADPEPTQCTPEPRC
jgi:hypothetical protein